MRIPHIDLDCTYHTLTMAGSLNKEAGSCHNWSNPEFHTELRAYSFGSTLFGSCCTIVILHLRIPRKPHFHIRSKCSVDHAHQTIDSKYLLCCHAGRHCHNSHPNSNVSLYSGVQRNFHGIEQDTASHCSSIAGETTKRSMNFPRY